MEVLRSKEHLEDKNRETHSKFRELESDNTDLKLLINQFVTKVKRLEADNLEKAKRIGELQGKKVEVHSENKDTILEMEISCSPSLICPHCTRIRNYVEFGKGRDPQASDYIKIADSRIEALQIQIRKMKATQTDLMDLVSSMKAKVEDRDAEIQKLRGMVKSGSGFENEINGNVNINRPNFYTDKDLALALKAAEMQLQILQRRNLNLEKKLKSSILQEHENFMLGHNVTAAERELFDTYMDINVDKYPFETLTMQEKINLLEAQLSHCCQEKAKLKLLLEDCELNHHPSFARTTPISSPPRKTKFKFNEILRDQETNLNEVIRPHISDRKSVSASSSAGTKVTGAKPGKLGLLSSVSDQHLKSVRRPTYPLKSSRIVAGDRSGFVTTSKVGSKSSVPNISLVKGRQNVDYVPDKTRVSNKYSKEHISVSQPKERNINVDDQSEELEENEFEPYSSPSEEELENISDFEGENSLQNRKPLKERSKVTIKESPSKRRNKYQFENMEDLEDEQPSDFSEREIAEPQGTHFKSKMILSPTSKPLRATSNVIAQRRLESKNMHYDDDQSQPKHRHLPGTTARKDFNSERSLSKYKTVPDSMNVEYVFKQKRRGSQTSSGEIQQRSHSREHAGEERDGQSRVGTYSSKPPSQLSVAKRESSNTRRRQIQLSIKQNPSKNKTGESMGQKLAQRRGERTSLVASPQRKTKHSKSSGILKKGSTTHHTLDARTTRSFDQLKQTRGEELTRQQDRRSRSKDDIDEEGEQDTQNDSEEEYFDDEEEEIEEVDKESIEESDEGEDNEEQTQEESQTEKTLPKMKHVTDRKREKTDHPHRGTVQTTGHSSPQTSNFSKSSGHKRNNVAQQHKYNEDNMTEVFDDHDVPTQISKQDRRNVDSRSKISNKQPMTKSALPSRRQLKDTNVNKISFEGTRDNLIPHKSKEKMDRTSPSRTSSKRPSKTKDSKYTKSPPEEVDESSVKPKDVHPRSIPSEVSDKDHSKTKIRNRADKAYAPEESEENVDSRFSKDRIDRTPPENRDADNLQYLKSKDKTGRNRMHSEERIGESSRHRTKTVEEDSTKISDRNGQKNSSKLKQNQMMEYTGDEDESQRSSESEAVEDLRGSVKGASIYSKRSFEESHPSEVKGKSSSEKTADERLSKKDNFEDDNQPLSSIADKRGTKSAGSSKDILAKERKTITEEKDPFEMFKEGSNINASSRSKDQNYRDDQSQSTSKKLSTKTGGPDSRSYGDKPRSSKSATGPSVDVGSAFKQMQESRKTTSSDTVHRPSRSREGEEEEVSSPPGMFSPTTSPPLSSAPRESSITVRKDQYQALVQLDQSKINTAFDNPWQKVERKQKDEPRESFEDDGEYSQSHSIERRRGVSSDEENANFLERNQRDPLTRTGQGRGHSLFRDPYETATSGQGQARLGDDKRVLSGDRRSNSNSFDEERPIPGSHGYDPFHVEQRLDSQSWQKGRGRDNELGPSHFRDPERGQDIDSSDSAVRYGLNIDFFQKDNERLKTLLFRKENEVDRVSTDYEILQRRVKSLQNEVDAKREALPLAAQSTIRRMEEERIQVEGFIRQHQLKQADTDRTIARNEEKAAFELRTLQTQLREIERIHDACKHEKQQSATLKLNLESEINKLRRDLNEAQTDSQQWRMDAQKTKLSLEQTERLLSEVQKRASGSSQYIPQREKQEMAHQIRQYAAREKDLERELGNLRSSLKSLDRDKDEMRVELDQKDERLASVMHDCSEHMDEIARLQLKLKNCELQIGHTGETTKEQDREMHAIRRQIDSLRKDLENASRERDEALKELRRISGVKSKGDADRRSVESELERVTKESVELKKQLQKYIDEVRRIEDLLLQKDEEMNTLMEHYRALTIENSTLESHRTSLEREVTTNREGVIEAMDQNYTLKSQISSQAALIKSYEDEIERLTQSVATLENKASRSEGEEKSLQVDIKAARELIHRLETNMDKYRLEAANMESMKNKLDAEKRDLQAYIDVLEGELNRERGGQEELEKLLASTREDDFKAKTRERELTTERDQLVERINLQQTRTEAMIEELSRYRLKATEIQTELDRVKRQYQIEKSEKDIALSDLKRLQESLNTSSMSNLIASALGGGSSSISPSQYGTSARGIIPTSGLNPRDTAYSASLQANPQLSSGPRSYTIESHQDQVLTPRSDSEMDLPLEASTSRTVADSPDENFQPRATERQTFRSDQDNF